MNETEVTGPCPACTEPLTRSAELCEGDYLLVLPPAQSCEACGARIGIHVTDAPPAFVEVL